MSHDRLPAGLEVGALRRQIESEGGHATLLHKGDEDRGSILLAVADRGQHLAYLERQLGSSGSYAWAIVGPSTEAEREEVARFVEQRRRFDPDLWVLELDTPRGERFIADICRSG